MATPESATLCGLPAASSVTVSVPLRGPVVVGENVIVTLQLAPAASVAGASGHAVLCVNSAAFAPPSAIELIVSGAFPVFVIFAVCCEVVPTLVVGSCSGLGDRFDLRLGEDCSSQPVLAVCISSGYQTAQQRGLGAHCNRNIRSPGDLDHSQGIGKRQLQRNISRYRSDGFNL